MRPTSTTAASHSAAAAAAAASERARPVQRSSRSAPGAIYMNYLGAPDL